MNISLIRAASQNGMPVKKYGNRVMNHRGPLHAVIIIAAVASIAGCTLNENSAQFSLGGDGFSENGSSSSKIVERDIEAPEIFQLTGAAVWDGRPSLGGIWVAHSSARSAEKVIIRNGQNGKFAIGALFRRAAVKVGPRIQMSADAAQALGAVAGQPINLDITALRPHQTSTSAKKGQSSGQDVAVKPSPDADKSQLSKVKTNLAKPFIQIGIFNVQQNAKNTATSMRQLGIIPLVKEQSKDGKPFWRVLVGPASSSIESTNLLEKVKSVGFKDAYAVTH